jgi:hypothetical protein
LNVFLVNKFVDVKVYHKDPVGKTRYEHVNPKNQKSFISSRAFMQLIGINQKKGNRLNAAIAHHLIYILN